MNFGDQFTNVRKFLSEGIEKKNFYSDDNARRKCSRYESPKCINAKSGNLYLTEMMLILCSEINPIVNSGFVATEREFILR